MGHKQSKQHRQFRHQDIDDTASVDFIATITATGPSTSNGLGPLDGGNHAASVFHDRSNGSVKSRLKRGLSMRNIRRSFHVPSSKKSAIKRARKVAATTDDINHHHQTTTTTTATTTTTTNNAPTMLPIDCGPSSSSGSVGCSGNMSSSTTPATPLPICTRQQHGSKLKSDTIVMDRLRRSFRNSFRRRKSEHVLESAKPHQWQEDEIAVRAGNCTFAVKYLGCVEVHESRGMQICEDALRRLRASRRRTVKGTLYVTGDGLRVVDEETKGLIVDQTIEKVSFCAPDRGHERGFSYICRDGATRRWMCHGFHAAKDTGERLSHAVGCAFSVCLERKQKRDKEAVQSSFDLKSATFTRTGSFRQSSITERMQDPQVVKTTEPPPLKPVHNPYAVERPHAAPSLLQRQGSLRGGPLNQASPFKRQLSLRLDGGSSSRLLNNNHGTLVTSPLVRSIDASKMSATGRERAHSLDLAAFEEEGPGAIESNTRLNQLASLVQTNSEAAVSTPSQAIPNNIESSSSIITAMCQELSQGLTLLSTQTEPLATTSTDNSETISDRLASTFESKNDKLSTSATTATTNSIGPVSISAFEKWINTSSSTATTKSVFDDQAPTMRAPSPPKETLDSAVSSCPAPTRISPTNPFVDKWLDCDGPGASNNISTTNITNPFLDLSQFASNNGSREATVVTTTSTPTNNTNNNSSQMFKAFEVHM